MESLLKHNPFHSSRLGFYITFYPSTKLQINYETINFQWETHFDYHILFRNVQYTKHIISKFSLRFYGLIILFPEKCNKHFFANIFTGIKVGLLLYTDI